MLLSTGGGLADTIRPRLAVGAVDRYRIRAQIQVGRPDGLALPAVSRDLREMQVAIEASRLRLLVVARRRRTFRTV